MQKVSGHFIADGDAINIDLGFVPDVFHAFAALGGTEVEYWWFRILADKATSGQHGITYDGTSGLPVVCADAANGFAAYNTKTDGVKVPAPAGVSTDNPDGLIKVPNGAAAATAATISDWSASVNYASSGQDRSASVAGTCVRPPVHNGRIFELVTGVGAGTSEPTSWDVQPGVQVTDGGTNVFVCREEILCIVGGKGITVGATISTDNDIWVYEAELQELRVDKGDAANNDPI